MVLDRTDSEVGQQPRYSMLISAAPEYRASYRYACRHLYSHIPDLRSEKRIAGCNVLSFSPNPDHRYLDINSTYPRSG